MVDMMQVAKTMKQVIAGDCLSKDVDVLARTIYGEARGEYKKSGLSPLIAIANVVMNRISLRTWFGVSIKEVCQKPWQFSCWNHDDPNYAIVSNAFIADPIFDVCFEVADKVASGIWPDLTNGADHYHSVCLKTAPSWTRGINPLMQIGNHVFYRILGK